MQKVYKIWLLISLQDLCKENKAYEKRFLELFLKLPSQILLDNPISIELLEKLSKLITQYSNEFDEILSYDIISYLIRGILKLNYKEEIILVKFYFFNSNILEFYKINSSINYYYNSLLETIIYNNRRKFYNI